MKKFHLNHETVMRLKESPSISTIFDWNVLYGKDVLSKYESLYVKLSEVTNALIQKHGGGIFYILASSMMCSVIEHKINLSEDVIFPQGLADIFLIGYLARKWELYCDPNFPVNEILIGVQGKTPALMTFINFG